MTAIKNYLDDLHNFLEDLGVVKSSPTDFFLPSEVPTGIIGVDRVNLCVSFEKLSSGEKVVLEFIDEGIRKEIEKEVRARKRYIKGYLLILTGTKDFLDPDPFYPKSNKELLINLMTPLHLKRLHKDAIPPKFSKPGDAGFDLSSTKELVLHSGEWVFVPFGWAFEIPEGFQLEIRPRSGLALRYGVTVLNSPGTVDSGYRGEVGAILINHGQSSFKINVGDRVAQGVLTQYHTADFLEVSELSETERGEGGFGSTGVGV